MWGDVGSTSAIGKGNKCGWTREGVGRTYLKKPTELFSKREFRERFRILNSISIRLINYGPVPTEKESHKAIVFSKEQFNVGFCFSFPSLFRQFFHFTKIPLAVVYPNAVKILMGSSILDMLFCLDLSLLKVPFIYMSKWAGNGYSACPLISLPFSWWWGFRILLRVRLRGMSLFCAPRLAYSSIRVESLNLVVYWWFRVK